MWFLRISAASLAPRPLPTGAVPKFQRGARITRASPTPSGPSCASRVRRSARQRVLLLTLLAWLPCGSGASEASAARAEAPVARKPAVSGSPARGAGSPIRGKRAIRKYGCVSCHKIPGVRGKIADPSLAGPSLAGIARRDSIGGAVTNRPDNLVRWLRDPLSVDPLTSMPDLGVTPRDARDIASYLYTLK